MMTITQTIRREVPITLTATVDRFGSRRFVTIEVNGLEWWSSDNAGTLEEAVGMLRSRSVPSPAVRRFEKRIKAAMAA